jgi:hypothetical protein
LVADPRLNPTYDLSFGTAVTVEKEQEPFILLFAVKHFATKTPKHKDKF